MQMHLRPAPLLERIPLAGPASVAVREFRRPAKHEMLEEMGIATLPGLDFVA